MNETGSKHVLLWCLIGICALMILIAVFLFRGQDNSPSIPRSTNGSPSAFSGAGRKASSTSTPHRYNEARTSPTAEEIVARKLKQFGSNRRELVHAIAQRFNVEVPDDVERFFDAVQSGRWEEIDAAHNALLLDQKELNQPRSADLHKIWRAIQETWGSAREVHDWPPQRLLDYGQAVLGSLKPGMIYVGGTDPGCFIPTFLNETTDGEHHITLTQNALADGTYLDYLQFLYGDQLKTLTQDDSQHAFQEYIADAQKRLQHDQASPDEPKQIRPGEDVRLSEGRVQVSGQVAVMAINERLFQTLMDKNPDATFAMEESFPFTSTYSNATPLGPILELRAGDSQQALTAERAAQSLDYWRTTAEQLLTDPETPDGSNPRKAYSKMVCAQAGLFLDHNFSSEAEEALRIANEICPSSPEAVFRYVNLLVSQKRFTDAIPVVENAITADPNYDQFRTLLNQLRSGK